MIVFNLCKYDDTGTSNQRTVGFGIVNTQTRVFLPSVAVPFEPAQVLWRWMNRRSISTSHYHLNNQNIHVLIAAVRNLS